MLISCKCLNFIATSNQQYQKPLNAAVATADAPGDCNILSANGASNGGNNLPNALMHAFLQRYPRNFIFYSQCMEFFKQSFGPIPDLTINAINQRDLTYSLTIDVTQAQNVQSWQISICINCNAALCAKRLPSAGAAPSPPQFLINCSLLTNNEELSYRRFDKSFSDTFGLLIMDHPQFAISNGTTGGAPNISLTIGSLSATPLLDPKQQRLRQLQQHMQQRLKREIAETDERIQRYTEQQFALLKGFREKSEQEYKLLMQLVQRVPDQQTADWLDRAPPALEVSGGVNYVSRRRNTIGSRRDLHLAPNTPTTTPHLPTSNMLLLPMTTSTLSAIETTNSMSAATALAANNNTTITANMNNRKLSNFDTPPATPEATPMSVGNSPTFRQQQQQQQQQQHQQQQAQQLPQPFTRLNNNTHTQSFQQQFPTPTVEEADDCLFELEGVDNVGFATVPTLSLNPPPHHFHAMHTQQSHQQYQRSHSNQPGNQMSDLDESDDAEEAEDALEINSSVGMPMNKGVQHLSVSSAQMINLGKSLPIEIANSPMNAGRAYMEASDDDELDNNVDIAASIKALAKSVHGETVFGDLPRPRFRSQI